MNKVYGVKDEVDDQELEEEGVLWFWKRKEMMCREKSDGRRGARRRNRMREKDGERARKGEYAGGKENRREKRSEKVEKRGGGDLSTHPVDCEPAFPHHRIGFFTLTPTGLKDFSIFSRRVFHAHK